MQLINKSNVNQRITNRKHLFSFGQRNNNLVPSAEVALIIEWEASVAE